MVTSKQIGSQSYLSFAALAVAATGAVWLQACAKDGKSTPVTVAVANTQSSQALQACNSQIAQAGTDDAASTSEATAASSATALPPGSDVMAANAVGLCQTKTVETDAASATGLASKTTESSTAKKETLVPFVTKMNVQYRLTPDKSMLGKTSDSASPDANDQLASVSEPGNLAPMTSESDAMSSPIKLAAAVAPVAAAAPVRPRAGVSRPKLSGKTPRIGVALRVQVKFPESVDSVKAAQYVTSLNMFCRDNIAKLFKRSDMPLDLKFVAISADANDYSGGARLNLIEADPKKSQDLFTFEMTPQPATFGPVGTAESTPACFSQGDQETCKDQLMAANDRFCQDLAKMTGHWLGLSDPRGCGTAAPAADKINPLDFMLGHDWQPPVSAATPAPPTAPAPGTTAAAAAAAKAASPSGTSGAANASPANAPPTTPAAVAATYWDTAKLTSGERFQILAAGCPGLDDAAKADLRAQQRRAARAPH